MPIPQIKFQLERSLTHNNAVYSAAFSHDGSQLATASLEVSARNTPATPKPGTRSTPPVTLALLLPATLLFTFRRKLRIPTLLLLGLTTLAAALTLSGCSGKYPPHTTPGTYTITITGTGP